MEGGAQTSFKKPKQGTLFSRKKCAPPASGGVARLGNMESEQSMSEAACASDVRRCHHRNQEAWARSNPCTKQCALSRVGRVGRKDREPMAHGHRHTKLCEEGNALNEQAGTRKTDFFENPHAEKIGKENARTRFCKKVCAADIRGGGPEAGKLDSKNETLF